MFLLGEHHMSQNRWKAEALAHVLDNPVSISKG